MIGEVLGNYRLCGQIGAGGMGVVYSAEHSMLGSKAAVKLLLPELSSNQQIVERFFNEAKAAATINHPGLITVFDFGYHKNGSAYIVMEFLEGESLAARLKGVPLDNELIVEFTRQAALALGAAHAQQIVHRDLKPDNLFLCPDPALPMGLRVKILDFGIAKLAGESTGVKTRTGSVMGTPTYMAPEQCRGAGKVDARADIYAMGCILFEMLVGRPPFEAEGVGEIMGKHMYEPPPTLESIHEAVHPGLAAVVSKALRKEPAERQQSMQEFGEELSNALGMLPVAGTPSRIAASGSLKAAVAKPLTTLGGAAASATRSPDTGSRRGLIASAVLLLLMAGVGSALLLRGDRDERPVSAGKEPGAPSVGSESQISVADAGSALAVTQSGTEQIQVQPVTLTVNSEPEGADVYRVLDQVRVGQTPYQIEMNPVQGELVFALRLKGFESAQIAVPTNEDHTELVTLTALEKRPTRPVRPRRPEGRALDPFANPR